MSEPLFPATFLNISTATSYNCCILLASLLLLWIYLSNTLYCSVHVLPVSFMLLFFFQVASADVSHVIKAIDSGFVPVSYKHLISVTVLP